VYVNVFLCVCTLKSIYSLNGCAFLSTNVCKCICKHACLYVYIDTVYTLCVPRLADMSIRKYMSIRMYTAYTETIMYVYMYIHVYMYMHCIYRDYSTYLCVHTCLYVHALYVHTCLYVHALYLSRL